MEFPAPHSSGGKRHFIKINISKSAFPKSAAPINKRKRIIPDEVKNLIIKERSYEKVGKEKLSVLLKEDGIGIYSPSTIGRMFGDLKKYRKIQSYFIRLE